MGIKGLKQFLLSKFPQALTRYHLSHLSGQKVAVDILTPLYKYKAAMGDNWKTGMLSFLLCFPRFNVHASVFTDGPCVPLEKKEEQQKRSSARDKIRDRVTALERELQEYRISGVIGEALKSLPTEASSQRDLLLGMEQSIDLQMVENYIEKLRKQVVSISSKDMEDIGRLCRVLEIPFYTAKSEAESICSWLCKSGRVDAVVTEDSDVLAYGAPVWISELDFQGNCMRIQAQDVYREMEFTPEQFVDFCILCGTDFNHRIEKLGPVTAYSLLKKLETIEAICEEKKITGEELNYQVVRGIFSKPCDTAIRSREEQVEVKVKTVYNRVPREERVLALLKRERLPMRYVRDFFEEKEQEIEFED
jgi:5'-3' exonuclease